MFSVSIVVTVLSVGIEAGVIDCDTGMGVVGGLTTVFITSQLSGLVGDVVGVLSIIQTPMQIVDDILRVLPCIFMNHAVSTLVGAMTHVIMEVVSEIRERIGLTI